MKIRNLISISDKQKFIFTKKLKEFKRIMRPIIPKNFGKMRSVKMWGCPDTFGQYYGDVRLIFDKHYVHMHSCFFYFYEFKDECCKEYYYKELFFRISRDLRGRITKKVISMFDVLGVKHYQRGYAYVPETELDFIIFVDV